MQLHSNESINPIIFMTLSLTHSSILSPSCLSQLFVVLHEFYAIIIELYLRIFQIDFKWDPVPSQNDLGVDSSQYKHTWTTTSINVGLGTWSTLSSTVNIVELLGLSNLFVVYFQFYIKKSWCEVPDYGSSRFRNISTNLNFESKLTHYYVVIYSSFRYHLLYPIVGLT